jgi:arylsulfatase A
MKHGIDLTHNYKGYKGQLADGGHRIPFSVRWPGTVAAGTTSDVVVCLNDFMATVADLLDVTLPGDAAEDSASILPLLKGETKDLAGRPMVVHHDYKGDFAIRDGKWKLIDSQLFDMKNDPKESADVVAEHPEVVKRMQETLARYQKSGRSRNAGR